MWIWPYHPKFVTFVVYQDFHTLVQYSFIFIHELGIQHICSPNRPIKIDTYVTGKGFGFVSIDQ